MLSLKPLEKWHFSPDTCFEEESCMKVMRGEKFPNLERCSFDNRIEVVIPVKRRSNVYLIHTTDIGYSQGRNLPMMSRSKSQEGQ